MKKHWRFCIALFAFFPLLAAAHHDPDEMIFAYCQRQKEYFDRHDKHNIVFGYFRWLLINKTDHDQHYQVTMRTCMLDGTGICNERIEQVRQGPWGRFVSVTYQVPTHGSFPGPGRYNFKVTLDITGDRHEHTEKTCEIVLRS